MTEPAIRSPPGEGPGRVSLSGTLTALTRTTGMLRQGQGWGLTTVHNSGSILDVFYPEPRIGDGVTKEIPVSLLAAQLTDDLCQIRTKVVRVVIDLDTASRNIEDAYLHLHLLNHRPVRPYGINLNGVFGQLPNNAWISRDLIRVENVTHIRIVLHGKGEILQAFSVDKFPRMTDYATPAGVRIGDVNQVRPGAHLASGTTVMHEGFVNFNAGILGVSMVEGRTSTRVVVGDGSDIGGGAPTMGTLSGDGQKMISIGEYCLSDTKPGIGISLDDDCVMETGLYVTVDTKVGLPGGRTVKT